MGFNFEPVTMHPYGLVDIFLTIQSKTALDDVDNFAVVWDGDCLSSFH